MDEYIKVKDLVDMLEQRLVFQETHGFYRDAGYTSRFIESIADIPHIDVAPKSEWISVEERLPDIDTHGKGRYGGARSVRVLCACKQRDGRTFVKEGYYEPCASGMVVWRIPGSIDSVTHWMPLPEPPKMKGGAE